MSSPTATAIATNLAAIFGAVTPPAGESAIALKTHRLPDELRVDDLPAILVWPPRETPIVQSGVDRSHLQFPVVLYLPRATKPTPERVDALYAWREAIRLLPQTVSAHLSVSSTPIDGLGAAGSYLVTVNDPADTLYGTQLYDTVRVDVEAVLHGTTVQWRP